MVGSLRSRMAIFLIIGGFSHRAGTRIPHGYRRRFGGVAACGARQSGKERVSSLQASTGDALDKFKLDDVKLSADAPEYGAPWLGNAGAGSEASRPRARSGVCRLPVSCICSMVLPERVIVIVIHNSRAAQQHNLAT